MKPRNSKIPEREIAEDKWIELPRDVMIEIFLKVGVINVLCSAQMVCSWWRKMAKEPQLFRCIDIREPWQSFPQFHGYDGMAREALNRNCGDLVEFSVEYFATDELIDLAIHKSSKSSSLRILRVISCKGVSDGKLIEIVRRNPFLEELELSIFTFGAKMIGTVGKLSLQLKSFRLNRIEYKVDSDEGDSDDEESDEGDSDDEDRCNHEAYAIANNMPQLRRLHLYGNRMNNTGLLRILDKCSYLEYLDLTHCFGLDLESKLLKKRLHCKLPFKKSNWVRS